METSPEQASEASCFQAGGKPSANILLHLRSLFLLSQCAVPGVAFQMRAPGLRYLPQIKREMPENGLRRPGYRTHASYNHNHKCLGWDLVGNVGLYLFP